jgi:ATP-dependent RNA helicase DDX19/DBP5
MTSLSGAKAAIVPTESSAATTAPPPTTTTRSSSHDPNGEEDQPPPPAAASKRKTAPPAPVPTIHHKAQEKKESDELTQRLQKLALDRQKESKGERLRIIQNDPSQTHLTSAKTFQELNLPKHLMEAIFAMGFDRPSAIQEEALPRILANPPHNLIGQAQSGSGKTVAFTLGMLFRIVVDTPATTQALCVSPTRELAIQIVEQAVRPMAANMAGLKIELAVAGERPVGRSIDAHIVVGTPGKVVDWIKRKYINGKTIKVFVLDEADNSTCFFVVVLL